MINPDLVEKYLIGFPSSILTISFNLTMSYRKKGAGATEGFFVAIFRNHDLNYCPSLFCKTKFYGVVVTAYTSCVVMMTT